MAHEEEVVEMRRYVGFSTAGGTQNRNEYELLRSGLHSGACKDAVGSEEFECLDLDHVWRQVEILG